jgi:glyoxalase family protein
MAQILGLHHVTAIAGDPQRNMDFFTGVLGMRLVKLTVGLRPPVDLSFVLRRRERNTGNHFDLFSVAERYERSTW